VIPLPSFQELITVVAIRGSSVSVFSMSVANRQRTRNSSVTRNWRSNSKKFGRVPFAGEGSPKHLSFSDGKGPARKAVVSHSLHLYPVFH
jgi:hypothetical protein